MVKDFVGLARGNVIGAVIASEPRARDEFSDKEFSLMISSRLDEARRGLARPAAEVF